MKRVHITGEVDCRAFRDWLYHLQAEELASEDRDRLASHAAACSECARYQEFEAGLLRGLQRRLPRDEAPAGLARRIGEALDREAPRVRAAGAAWYRLPAVSALAAAMLLVALLVPSLSGLGELPGGAPIPGRIHGSWDVTVVDGDCDRAGHTLQEQLACRHARHLNVLKTSSGMYMNISTDTVEARELVLDPAQRGRRLVVEADYYPSLHAVRLIRVSDPRTQHL